ncbi:MAG TPA: transcriptional regulator [Ktedonobacteraceae bacterium]|nr:transcriptional regulator [Ktedonobacteraceae bacterium]
MQDAVGKLIRRLRREQGLTQTKLGGGRYSKSYVSGVECDAIVPSAAALRFFARQLQQEENFFLKRVGEQAHHYFNKQEPQERGTSQETQAQALLLSAHLALQQEQTTTALTALEQALALAPVTLQPAILDEMGLCYALLSAHELALRFHQRALTLLQQIENVSPALLLNVHLHCAHACRALGAYQQACEHFEQARQRLSTQQDMKTAALIYLGLGYCTWAALYQRMLSSAPVKDAGDEEMERVVQQSAGLLGQSKVLYQACNDDVGEAIVSLMQTMIILDMCVLSRQMARKHDSAGKLQYQRYLDEAEGQCRQVLFKAQENLNPSSFHPREDILWTALAYLIRVALQSAIQAQQNGQKERAEQQLARATGLCQELLSLLVLPQVSLDAVQRAITVLAGNMTHQPLSLSRLLEKILQENIQLSWGKLEAFYAAGEVFEELGRLACSPKEAREYFSLAHSCFQKTLSWPQSTMLDEQPDGGERLRRYLRYINLLEERSQLVPALEQETSQTLLATFREVSTYQHRLLKEEAFLSPL